MPTITLSRNELLYDICNLAYVEGHRIEVTTPATKVVGGPSPEALAHQVTDIAQEGNIDRVDRILDLVYASTLSMLAGIGLVVDIPEIIDNTPTRPEFYLFDIPDGSVATASLPLLARLVHEYMVAGVLADWLAITHPDATPKWRIQTSETATAISSLIRAGGCRLRRCAPW